MKKLNTLLLSMLLPLFAACGAVCGDGLVEDPEACDDGNVAAGDGCDAACAVENGFACAGAPSVCETVCGDGVLAGDEICDDGNTTPGDGCDAVCECGTCGEALQGGNPEICVGASLDLALAIVTCACTAGGGCEAECVDTQFCDPAGGDPVPVCVPCVQDPAAGCGNELSACLADI